MTTSSVSPVTTELAGSETGITLVIHAGAGSRGKHSTPERIAQVELDLQRALDAGYQLLESGAPAHEAVVAAIHVMEDAPEFNAGRGAALTSDGIAQMDACLMTGDGEVGAVTGVSTVKNPIDAARAVKEQTKHVLFADPTDAEIADWGVATESNEYFITEQRRQSLAEAQSGGDEWEKHGTIGAVARDAEGNIAAGTSTGGITNQMHGRVGDSPLPGCGTFANQSTVAVSCTGIGVHQGGRRPSGVGSCAFLRRERRGCRDGHFGRSRRASWRWRHDRSAGGRPWRGRLQQRDDELRIP